MIGSVMAGMACGAGVVEERVLETTEVDRIWAAHLSSPPVLVTAGGRQYVTYYDAERRLTLAWRRLGEELWERRGFPVVTTWATGGHAQIALTVDAEGILHLIPYRRDLSEAPDQPPAGIYYRSERPHDPESMERVVMVSEDEPAPHYPVFLTAADGGLFFECRIGVSGRGDQVLYRYDSTGREWRRMGVLMDGRGEMSAYGGPRLGPDGRWHCLWMWRNTSDAATNHRLSYMVSKDLRHWTNAAGVPLELPVKPDNEQVVVDAAGPGGGLINPLKAVGYDSRQRPVISYHVYGPDGNSTIQNARFEEGAWKRVAAQVWDHRWDFGGGGAVVLGIDHGPVKPVGNGRLVQRVWSARGGTRDVLLDEGTLEPLGEVEAGGRDAAVPAWQTANERPEIDFPLRPLSVAWLRGKGGSGEAGVSYFLRWEHGPVNAGDQPVPEPWPPAAPLRVFKVGPP